MPFAFLPVSLGAFVWGILDAGVLYYAIRQLPIKHQLQNAILILSANEMMNATSNLQSNGIMAATIILSFVYIIKQKEIKSSAMIMLGFFIKLYSITGIAFFFFSKFKKTFILSLLFWLVFLILLPLIATSPDFLIQSYKDWAEALSLKSNFDITRDMHINMVDITVQGMVKRVFDLPTLNKLYFIIPGLILFFSQYAKIKYFNHLGYRLYMLCSVMLFVIVFNTGSESPTYIIGVVPICIWYALQKKSNLIHTLFIIAIFFSSFSYSDIFTPWLRKTIMIPYALKVVGCLLIWLIIVVQIHLKQFLTIDQNKLRI
jgi:hypothetical protein